MYDEIGCLEMPDAYLAPLIAVGCEVGSFRSTKGSNPFQLNFRNHRKVVVVDGRVVVEDGHSTLVDEERLFARAQEMGEAITARSGLPDKAKYPTW